MKGILSSTNYSITMINVENRMVASDADSVNVAAPDTSQHLPWDPSSPLQVFGET